MCFSTHVLQLEDDLSNCSDTLPLHYVISSGRFGSVVQEKKVKYEIMNTTEVNNASSRALCPAKIIFPRLLTPVLMNISGN